MSENTYKCLKYLLNDLLHDLLDPFITKFFIGIVNCNRYKVTKGIVFKIFRFKRTCTKGRAL